MEHLATALIMALVAQGAFVAMGEGMVLAALGRLLASLTLPAWLRKPLYACPRCMVSLWGLPAVFLLGMVSAIWTIPVYLLTAVGIHFTLFE